MRFAAALLAAVTSFVGCSSEGISDKPTPETPVGTERCIVRLHGKGGEGSAATVVDGVGIVTPPGNASGWNGRQWIYFPDERYEEALKLVTEAAAGCERIILNGFSNGGAFATKLYCQGETFGGRLIGVVIDDPVTDGSADGCAPGEDVSATLYWTGALESVGQPGRDCKDIDWTCEGGKTLGIAAFAAKLGVELKPSPFDEHVWYLDAPELSSW